MQGGGRYDVGTPGAFRANFGPEMHRKVARAAHGGKAAEF